MFRVCKQAGLIGRSTSNSCFSYFKSALTKSGPSYGLSTVSNLEDGEPNSHVSIDSSSPKITGILSVTKNSGHQ